MNQQVALFVELLGKRKPTRKQLQSLCDSIPNSCYTHNVSGYKSPTFDADVLKDLQKAIPQFKWRVIICHDSEYTYTAITFRTPDPREHEEMLKHGDWYDGVYRKHGKKKK
jgi:hypothetical protein